MSSVKNTTAPISTVCPEGTLMKSPGFRPRNSTVINSNVMWTIMVDTLATPMPATALGSSTPFICKNRTFVAMPPTLTGQIRLTNDPASWTRVAGISRTRSGTDPITL